MFSTKNQLEIIDNNSPQALEFLDLSTRWNHFMSQEQTLNYLGMHEISSSTHVLEMCRILSEAKAQWKETNVTPVTITKKNGSGLNKRVEVKKFIDELKKRCSKKLEPFKIPMKIEIKKNIKFNPRFKKNRNLKNI